MFTVELYINRAYRKQGKAASKNGAAVIMHRLRQAGKVRIMRKGSKIPVLSGRMVENGDRFEFKAE